MSVKTLTHVDPFDSARQRGVAGVFGMWVFIAVVAMIFVSCILGYLVVRFDQPPGREWMPKGTPPLPGALLLSTAVLLVSSWTMQDAVRAVRQGRLARAEHAMAATLGLALVFLAVQALAWTQLWRAQATIMSGLYAWTFYVLTALHALHVIGGLVPLCVVCWRAARGRYSPQHPEGVMYCAMYWHFLDAVWLLLYATLWLGSLTW